MSELGEEDVDLFGSFDLQPDITARVRSMYILLMFTYVSGVRALGKKDVNLVRSLDLCPDKTPRAEEQMLLLGVYGVEDYVHLIVSLI